MKDVCDMWKKCYYYSVNARKMDSKLHVVPLGMRLHDGFGKSVQNGETFDMFFKEKIAKLVLPKNIATTARIQVNG